MGSSGPCQDPEFTADRLGADRSTKLDLHNMF